jgi:hypothetical protein
MLTISSKNVTRRRVHKRIRKKVLGTAERPRLNVYRSLNNIYVQVIDDLQGVTLVSANSAEGKKGTGLPAGTLRRPRQWESRLPNARRKRASAKLCLTAAGTSIMGE